MAYTPSKRRSSFARASLDSTGARLCNDREAGGNGADDATRTGQFTRRVPWRCLRNGRRDTVCLILNDALSSGRQV